MPLFYQHNINAHTKLAIWRIEEPEDFFLQKVPLKTDVTHPFKRLQHLAGRYLLPLLFADFPLTEILIADTRKPFLPGEKYHFSISHSGSFAAAIVSTVNRVGMDIESITPRIRSLSHKFISGTEEAALEIEPDEELLTILWCAKESIFKWYSLGEIDFRRHMVFRGPIGRNRDELSLRFAFEKGSSIALDVQAKVIVGEATDQPMAMAWVVT